MIDMAMPVPTAREIRILDAYRDQKPIMVKGEMCLILSAQFERTGPGRCRLAYSYKALR